MARKRKSLPLRIDPELHVTIERWAADELRSANGQIEFLLRQAAIEAGRLPQTISESQISDGASPKDPDE